MSATKVMMQANEYTKLRQFSRFETLDELNDTVSHYLTYTKLGRTERQFLRLLSRYSAFDTHRGVCWRKAATLADELEVTTRSISRYIATLVKLGIVAIVETYSLTADRKAKRGANIFVILPYQKEEVLLPQAEANHQSEDNMSRLIKREKQSNTKTKRDTGIVHEEEVSGSHLKNSIPKALYNMLKIFHVKDMYTLIGVIFRAKASISSEVTIEENEGLYMDALRGCIFNLKRNKVRNLYSYIFSAVQRVTAQITRMHAQTGSWLDR
ncbi:helix-turn-helix domain-containing protein [Paenalkalicoccus suaedae]|uniref:Helix-turn-helix domain-containing protein n=1 Tax=Paenalkalicoccus suaedae TaxID=2592382 RepID=A0A859FHB3_9BACI|nr:HTH domain-containing protein [Paenalkalicoccus suaedae]QKS72054.1 helix-turn-helix domain-containing protein [Paenalkalicoccus suaedae]